MQWTVVGLGNPGKEYEYTRHNAGRAAVSFVAKENDAEEWKEHKKACATVAKGVVAGANTTFVLPDTFMNKSGSAVTPFVKSVKAAERLIVVYDDLDLPLGTIKISFDRGSGGHKGVESITRAIKTKKFARIRIGITPTTPSGKPKKPLGEEKVLDFILKGFTESERKTLTQVYKKVTASIDTIIEGGVVQAMNEYN